MFYKQNMLIKQDKKQTNPKHAFPYFFHIL